MARNPTCFSVVVNVRDSFANGAFIEDRFLVNQAGHESGRADLIDAAGNALGVLEDALQSIVGKERTGLVASDLGLVLDVADSLLQIEWAEVTAHGQALVEGLVNREMEGAAEIGMADQHHGGERLTVHFVTEEQAQLFEHGLGQEMRLIEDNDWSAMLVGVEVVQGGTDTCTCGAVQVCVRRGAVC